MFTCTKEYNDIPFAHRQPKHDGHCALIHGHNWGIKVEFSSDKLDECGFVVDFGKLKPLKRYLERFDHALVVNQDDDRIAELQAMSDSGLARLVVVESCSSEGLAKHFYDAFTEILANEYGGRVTIKALVVTEDSKNSATYYG